MMEDIQNAINSLEITLIRNGNINLIKDVFSVKTLKTAIKALEKQIPKQINIKINEFKAEDGYCPNCNERIEVAVWASEYCYECGQKIRLGLMHITSIMCN